MPISAHRSIDDLQPCPEPATYGKSFGHHLRQKASALRWLTRQSLDRLTLSKTACQYCVSETKSNRHRSSIMHLFVADELYISMIMGQDDGCDETAIVAMMPNMPIVLVADDIG